MTGLDLVAASGVNAAPDISVGHLLLQMVVALAVVAGGIWGFGKLVGRSRTAGRRAGRKAGGLLRSRTQDQGLTILSRQPLGKGKCLAVVQVGAQQFLVGIADSGLTPLGELRAREERTRDDEVQGDVETDQSPTAPVARKTLDLGALDLRALGVRSVDFDALDAARGSSQTAALGAPVNGAAASQPVSRSIRTWVDALREATVRH